MDQPLWQIWLNIAWIAFVARRAGVGVALHWEQLSAPLRFGYCAVLGVCALAGITVWLPARWVIAGLVAVAIGFSVVTLIELAPGVAVIPTSSAVVQWAIAMLAGGLLMRLAWRADHADHSHAR